MSQARLPRTEPSTELITAHKGNNCDAHAALQTRDFSALPKHRVKFRGLPASYRALPGDVAAHCEKRPGPNLPRKSPISMARADSPRAARRACSAHTPSPRLAPAPAAPHWSLAAASTRDGSATCSITPMRPPEPHPERPGVGCSQQQESQRDGPSSATD